MSQKTYQQFTSQPGVVDVVHKPKAEPNKGNLTERPAQLNKWRNNPQASMPKSLLKQIQKEAEADRQRTIKELTHFGAAAVLAGATIVNVGLGLTATSQNVQAKTPGQIAGGVHEVR
jgi:hypothetical protein